MYSPSQPYRIQPVGRHAVPQSTYQSAYPQYYPQPHPGSMTPMVRTTMQQPQGNRVFGGQPNPNYQMNTSQYQRNVHPPRCGPGNMQNRTRVTPARTMSVPTVPSSQVSQQKTCASLPQIPSGMKTYATTAGIPPEVEANPNTQYIRMNWEDILGRQGGLQGLHVSMAAATGDPNANRQIRIGMGGSDEAHDGSTPLRIVSFQPVDDYPGLKEPTSLQPGQPKFSVVSGPQALQGQQQSPSNFQQAQYQRWTNQN